MIASEDRRGARYLVAKRSGRAYLHLLDAVLRVARSRQASADVGIPPRRVLVSVGGQLGDAVLATGVFASIQDALPDVTLGVLSGARARVVFDGRTDVRWIHTFDHWKHDRSATSLVARTLAHWSRWRQVAREIADVGYDAALDLCPFYPNSATLFWAARIPRRIGYASGGGGPLFTDVAPAPDNDTHVTEHHGRLVAQLLGSTNTPEAVVARLPARSEQLQQMVRDRLRGHGITDEYVVMHVGAGSRPKEWPLDRWQELVADVHAMDHAIVLTGRGEREQAMAATLAGRQPGVVNLVDQLEWNELVDVIRDAAGVISPDTAVAHVAAAVGTPNVVIWAGINDPRNWRPRGARTSITMHPVSCAPCFRPDGCSHMRCVNEVSSADVRSAMESVGIDDALRRRQPAL